MAEEEKPTTPPPPPGRLTLDVSKLPEELRTVLVIWEQRLAAFEGLFLQFAVDVRTLATCVNAVQQHVTGLAHERMSRDLAEIHTRWSALLKQAEQAGLVRTQKVSSIILPSDGVKLN